MEKRLKKTLPLTLSCGAGCTKLVLLIALFSPVFWGMDRVPEPIEAPAPPLDSDAPAIGESPRSKQLVKVYGIVKTRRPEMAEGDAWHLSEVILAESFKHHLDPLLVLALIQIESDFRHEAVSPVGARGLMQIMPDTGKYLAESWHRERGLRAAAFRPESLDDPSHNIRLGTYYLHGLRKQFRNLHLALVAYNLGPGEVQNRIENDLEFSDQFATVVLDTYYSYKKNPPRF
jgi:hypothetical protein